MYCKIRFSEFFVATCLSLSFLATSLFSVEVQWISGSGGDWNDSANWSTAPLLPGIADDVIIDVPSAEVTVNYNAGTSQILSLNSKDDVSISGGTLRLTGNSVSEVAGRFTMNDSTLSINGSNFSATGPTSISNAVLDTRAGQLRLPNLMSYENSSSTSINSINSSVVELHGLTSMEVGGSLSMTARQGSSILAPNLASIDRTSTRSFTVHVEDAGSVIDLSSTSNFGESGINRIIVENAGQLIWANPTSVDGIDLKIVNDGVISISQISQADDAAIEANGGAVVSMSSLANYATTGKGNFRSNGENSLLDLSGVSNIALSGSLPISAQFGGRIDLSSLTNIENVSNGRISLLANGPNSVVDLSSLNSESRHMLRNINVENEGTVLWGAPTTMKNANLRVSGNGSIDTSQISSIETSEISVLADATLSFPALTTFTDVGTASLTAGGLNAVLEMPNLTELTTNGIQIIARDSGRIDLSNLTNITNTGTIFVRASSDGVVDISGVTAFGSNAINSIIVEDGGEVIWSNPTSVNSMRLEISGSGKLQTAQLARIDDSSLDITRGASLALPEVAEYTTTQFNEFIATGAGSTLDLSNIARMTIGDNFSIEARNGGAINLSGLSQFDQAGHSLSIVARGQNASVDLTGLEQVNGGTIRASDGKIVMSQTAIINDGLIELENDGAIETNHLILAHGSRLNGEGTILGSLTIENGRLNPQLINDPTIQFHIEGDLIQSSQSHLNFDMLSLEDHDLIQVTGSAQIGGRITLRASDEFQPALGDTIDVLTAESVTGSFSQVDNVGIPGTLLGYAPIYDTNKVSFRASLIADVNLDNEFNSTDLILIFQAGEYEDGIEGNSTWFEGDWTGDGDFGTADLIAAFQTGVFETGPVDIANQAPEPNGVLLLILLPLSCWMRRRLPASV